MWIVRDNNTELRFIASQNRVTRKFSPGCAIFLPFFFSFLFFNWFYRDILFSSFCILVFVFACLFVFWNFKYIFWCTFDYARGWVIIFFQPIDFRKQDYFFGLIFIFLFFSNSMWKKIRVRNSRFWKENNSLTRI